MTRRLGLGLCIAAVLSACQQTSRTPLEVCYESAATRLEVGGCLEALLEDAQRELDERVRAERAELEDLARATGRPKALEAFERAQYIKALKTFKKR